MTPQSSRTLRSWRLLPVAVTVWVTNVFLLAGHGSLPNAPAGAAPWGVIAVGIVGSVMAFTGAIGRRCGRPLVGGSLLLIGLAAIVAGLVSAPRLAQLSGEPWAGWVDHRARIVADVTLQTAPRRLPGPDTWQQSGGDPTGLMRASAVVQNAADTNVGYRLRAPVDILVPAADIDVGDTVKFEARVSSGSPGRAARLTAVGPVTKTGAGSDPGRWLRTRFRAALADEPVAQRELALGMVLGDDSGLPDSTADDLRAVGLSHLTAVSGANIAIVAAIAALLGRILLPARRLGLTLVAAGIGCYVLLVGFEPSVLRAAVMAAVAMVGVVVGGGTGIAALLFTATALLIIDPYLSLSRGFALSCAATAGLVLVAPTAARAATALTSRWPLRIAGPVVAVLGLVMVTVSAQLATAPLLLSYGQGISIVSAAANLLAAPAVPIITTVGLAVAAVAAVSPAAAAAVGDLVGLPAGWILGVVDFVVSAPVSGIAVASSAVVTATAVLVATSILVVMRRHPRVGVGIAVAVVTASLLMVRPPVQVGARAPRDWLAVFCDVGQGDAAVLRTGPASGVVIDSAPDPQAARRCLEYSGIEHLDALVLSHFHQDHVGGLSALLARWRPAAVLGSPLSEPALTFRKTVTQLRTRGLSSRPPGFGERAEVGWLSWQVLWPETIIRSGSAANNASLCLLARVSYQGRSTTFLLSGDIEVESQAALAAAWPTVQVDVAKVPHHGSRRQHPGLPLWAGADLAVISVGRDNDYGHPASNTVAAWQRAGSEVLRTDIGGHIALTRDPVDGRLLVTRSAPTDSGAVAP